VQSNVKYIQHLAHFTAITLSEFVLSVFATSLFREAFQKETKALGHVAGKHGSETSAKKEEYVLEGCTTV
jgi:hypothetical protein